MRVLHVIPSVSAVHGGPSVAIRMFEQALADRGIEVETATTDDDGPGGRLLIPLGKPVTQGKTLRWYFRKDTEFYKVSWALLGWVLREVRRFDVVHIHALFSFASVAAAWAAMRAGVPYIIRPLGVLNRYGIDERRPYLKRISLQFIEGPLLRRAAAVHVTSEAEKAEVLGLGIPLTPVVVPLGIDPAPAGTAERFIEAKPEARGKSLVLFMSRIDPKKNLGGLIRALGILRGRSIEVVLLVGGSGDESYIGELKSLAAAEGVSAQIEWLGYVSGEAKADALAAAHVFVLPSFSENFGIAAVEAMAAGVPCVLGCGVALSEEVAAAGAGIAVAAEPRDIAEGVAQVLRDEAARRSMSLKAAMLARERFSLDAMGRELERSYVDICYRARQR